MDAASAALADLLEISSQVEAAVLFGADGTVSASTLDDELRAKRFAEAAKRLFDVAVDNEQEIGSPPLHQLEAATVDGSVFVVREGERTIAAVTGVEPTVGLVFYDLKTALRQAGQGEQGPPERPKRTRSKKVQAPEAETASAESPSAESESSETQHAAP